ncbi:MAG: dTMP kinase [Salinirussus sp.]
MIVTLEGLDGSGKTSVWEALQEGDPFSDLVFTREPTETWYGEAVRRSLEDPTADPLAECFLYTADHAAHLAGTIQPALDRGATVISDRYSDSRYAYQGVTLADRIDDPMRFVRDIHRPWTKPPDLTLYLDVDPETAAQRSSANDKFERVDTLGRVRENYERLISAEPDRFIRIDAERPIEAVTTAVRERLLDVL